MLRVQLTVVTLLLSMLLLWLLCGQAEIARLQRLYDRDARDLVDSLEVCACACVAVCVPFYVLVAGCLRSSPSQCCG